MEYFQYFIATYYSLGILVNLYLIGRLNKMSSPTDLMDLPKVIGMRLFGNAIGAHNYERKCAMSGAFVVALLFLGNLTWGVYTSAGYVLIQLRVYAKAKQLFTK